MNEDKILNKLIEHDERFDKIIFKLIDHDERLDRMEETMFTKQDAQQMTSVLESIATVCKNIQEDHAFSIEWIRRLDTKIELQEKEIDRIKTKLAII